MEVDICHTQTHLYLNRNQFKAEAAKLVGLHLASLLSVTQLILFVPQDIICQ